MAAITITLNTICVGTNHLTYDVTGAKVMTVGPLLLSEIFDPVTEEEALAFVRIVTKLAKSGRTIAAAKTLLQVGVTVSI